METKPWIYYGVFFDDKTQTDLLNFAKQFVSINENWKVFCNHMTIIYNDKSKEKEEMAQALDKFIGNKQNLVIDGIGVSDRAIALSVKDYVTQNKHSHVTIATAPDAKPVESNNITNWYKTKETLPIMGTLDVVMKRINIKRIKKN